ncbi:MAG: polyphosphate kinase 2 [Beijerinckiaceae bacterium]
MSKEKPDDRGGEEKKKKGNAAGFDIRTPKLPEWVHESAFESGGFPYEKKLKRSEYDEELRQLQIEQLKALDWIKKNGERVVVVFEGRDSAGKGGTIQRVTEHLNPRSVKVVALTKPTEQEQGQWYFQRYIAHMPTRGEMAIFDRSWYNRAGVERVFGFCTPQQTESFLSETPGVEAILARDGKFLIKFFLTIGPEMQMKRLHARWHDPLARWKLSDLDFKALEKWEEYSQAYENMLRRTDTASAPWTVLRANDKRRLRLEAIRYILKTLPYAGKDEKLVARTDPKIVLAAATFLGLGGEDDRIS